LTTTPAAAGSSKAAARPMPPPRDHQRHFACQRSCFHGPTIRSAGRDAEPATASYFGYKCREHAYADTHHRWHRLVGTTWRELAGGRHIRSSRDPSKARNFPEGVTAVAGDLREPASSGACSTASARFLLNPVSQTEANRGLGLNAMREAA
jgi:hypothetical protein